MKILYAVSEAFPFVKSSGLGDVAYAFPQTVKKLGTDIHVIMPLYDVIADQYHDQMELVMNFTLELGLETLYCGLYKLNYEGVCCYFVENDTYFMRGKLYGCKDDDIRFAFFSKAVCESIRHLGWFPDVVHCNDWQTALIPFYLKDVQLRRPELCRIRTLFTIHNVEFQGNFSYHTLTDVFGLSGSLFSEGTLELDGKVNLMKGAIAVSDVVTTVSPTYARDLTEQAGGMLSGAIASKGITGILNGIHDRSNPLDSRLVHCPYTAEGIQKRVENKLWMQELHGLRVSEKVPVLGTVSRLMQRKGFELILEVMPEYLDKGCQFLVSGDGDRDIWDRLMALKDRYPGQVEILPYSEESAVALFSSLDLFLMPSQVEPCGTTQMLACRYGCVPIVHMTGGLFDTVVPFDENHPEGYCFGFTDYSTEAFRDSIADALVLLEDSAAWEAMQLRCMNCDFSWNEPAKEYISLYKGLLK